MQAGVSSPALNNETVKAAPVNPLGVEPVGKLLLKFSVPAIMSFLVNALYNIVDQIFIGQSVGYLGNAATNVAFPLTTICTAMALLIGVGSASNFNLKLGAGRKEEAKQVAGNGFILLILSGIFLAVIVGIFLKPMMIAFGASESVLPYALTYTGIINFGIPFVILSTGGSHLIRADGSPNYSMACLVSGALINLVLDPVLIFGLNMGIAGAALATIIGQFVSGVMVILYIRKFKNGKLGRKEFTIQKKWLKIIASLGSAACFNQLAMTIVQITMNQTLTRYGAMSEYGSDIPLACVGVISKLNIVLIGFSVGISQGSQPINGYNYGAGNYARVKETYRKAAAVVTIISAVCFLAFQIFPRQIISAFGNGNELYFNFSIRYLRIFMFMTFINGIQPLTSNFFTSIGKARMGIFISLTRQILFLLPLILIFPVFLGVEGVMYAGPVADAAAAAVALVFIVREMKNITRLEKAAGEAG